jgi:hypothetical protein
VNPSADVFTRTLSFCNGTIGNNCGCLEVCTTPVLGPGPVLPASTARMTSPAAAIVGRLAGDSKRKCLAGRRGPHAADSAPAGRQSVKKGRRIRARAIRLRSAQGREAVPVRGVDRARGWGVRGAARLVGILDARSVSATRLSRPPQHGQAGTSTPNVRCISSDHRFVPARDGPAPRASSSDAPSETARRRGAVP